MALDLQERLRDELEDWKGFARDLQHAFRGDAFDQPLPGFTKYEGQMLRLLAKHTFVRYEQIVEALREGPHDLGPTPGSTKTMISRIRTKLENHRQKPKTEIKCIWGSGWYATDQKAMQRFIDKISPVQSSSQDVRQAA